MDVERGAGGGGGVRGGTGARGGGGSSSDRYSPARSSSVVELLLGPGQGPRQGRGQELVLDEGEREEQGTRSRYRRTMSAYLTEPITREDDLRDKLVGVQHPSDPTTATPHNHHRTKTAYF